MIIIKEVKLFVPGRLCLIGGVSDLVSPYLSQNKDLVPGCAIACTIDKGIYSTVKKSDKLKYNFEDVNFEIDANYECLKKEANSNTFFSYICGTVLELISKYDGLGGIDITITKMDLPIKKGLSSSAAICLTIVKAYNELYNLEMTKDEIILHAYNGEHLAGSKCGFLDQYTILNNNCSFLTFYQDKVVCSNIILKNNLYVLVVDLNGNKNTRIIMNAFNNALPFPKNESDKLLLDIIGNKNVELVQKSIYALENGDSKLFGKCLSDALRLYDIAKVACLEYDMPLLYKVFNDDEVKRLSYGGKCVGSGGDGSLLLVCINEESQKYLKKYIKDKFQMESLDFCIKGEKSI